MTKEAGMTMLKPCKGDTIFLQGKARQNPAPHHHHSPPLFVCRPYRA
ncbi:MAG: hypothetical protein ACR2P4_00215 [Gammaproteobacteria bacterium]